MVDHIYRFSYACNECGQKNDLGYCTRCDELCMKCKEKRRDHYIVDRREMCPTVFFQHSKVYLEK